MLGVSHSRSGRGSTISPIGVFALILAVAFAVETAIMLALGAMPREYRRSLPLALLDSTALVAVLWPALWLLVVRPLRTLVGARGALLSSTLAIQEAERARLARDLHDDLGQTQAAALLGLRGILNAATLEQAVERGRDVHRLMQAAADATRRIARGLSPALLRDFGLAAAVERVCEDFVATSGVEIERRLATGDDRLDPAIEIAAYRVVQEAVTNAVRHAAAKRIRVEISRCGGQLEISVSDDGIGIRRESADFSARRGLGLAGMRERVVLLGGAFRLDSAPSSGTRVHATLPARPVTT